MSIQIISTFMLQGQIIMFLVTIEEPVQPIGLFIESKERKHDHLSATSIILIFNFE